MLEIEFVELLFAVHYNDQWDGDDEESGGGDPRRLASALGQPLPHVGGVTGGALAFADY